MPNDNGSGPGLQVVAPPITPPGKKLTEEERLSIENIYLKLQNCQLQVQNLDAMKNEIVGQMRQLKDEMEKKRAELTAKYGVPIERTSVKADGTIVETAKE